MERRTWLRPFDSSFDLNFTHNYTNGSRFKCLQDVSHPKTSGKNQQISITYLEDKNDMQTKSVFYSTDARERMMRGIDQLAEAVKVTLGPQGRTVIVGRQYSAPFSTKDGVTVAKEFFLDDHVEDIGAQMLKQVALRTSIVAGDGTTTATVLGQGLLRESIKAISSGMNPMRLKKGLLAGTAVVVEALKVQSKPVTDKDDLLNVATISANGDAVIGGLIADAFDHVGRDGFVTFVEGKKNVTELNIVDGLTFASGMVEPHFVTNTTNQTCELENPYILFHEGKFVSNDKIMPVLNMMARHYQENPGAPRRPLLIVADDFQGIAISTLVKNAVNGVIPNCCVRAPAFGHQRTELLNDMALLTGAKLVPIAYGDKLESIFDVSMLGSAERIIVSKDRTIIINGNGDAAKIEKRKAELTEYLTELNQRHDADEEHKRHIQMCSANFSGMAMIHVGGRTEVEMRERYYRVEDAVHATKAALDEGILPGGGVALIKCISVLNAFIADETTNFHDDTRYGARLLRNVLTAPCMQIALNAGISGELVVKGIENAESLTYGYDALNEEFVDMIEAGIIDPTKVVRTALEDAVSVVSTVMTTEAIITNSENAQAPNPLQMLQMG